jgi:hypothetical protein
VDEFRDIALVVNEPVRDDGVREENHDGPGDAPVSSELVDSTIPAHDPNFPKPRGLLPVPPKVAEWVAEAETHIAREHGVQIAPEARRKLLDDWTLNYYYDGTYIAYRRTPQGVEVLAVGWDEAHKFRQEHPPETRRDVEIGTV